MTAFLTLLTSSPYLSLLDSLAGWAGWLALLGLAVTAAVRARGKPAAGLRRWGLLALFLVLVPPANLFLAVRFSAGAALPVPGLPSGHSPTLLVFSALPWMLAGGFLGPLEALLVGLATGVVRGLWDTHNLFSLLEPAVLAVLFSLAMRQRYRTWFYRAMRQPALTALGLVPVYALVFVYGALLSIPGAAAARLDYALTNLLPAVLAAGGELLAGGLFAQVIALALPRAWGLRQPLEPSPAERSLQTRILLAGGTLIAVLLLALVLGDWILAGNAARRMLRDRLASSAQATAGGVPFLLETGQSLATRLAADPRLQSDTGAALSADLAAQMQTFPYFDQLFLLDLQGNVLAAYPAAPGNAAGLAQAESAGLSLAAQGVPAQVYSLPPAAGQTTARLAFLAAVSGTDGRVHSVLLGRTLLADNPLAQPLLDGLRGMAALGGTGRLLDDQDQVLYSPNADELMTVYPTQSGRQALFYDLPAPGGTRDLVYYQPVTGQAWSVVLSVPAAQAQQLTLEIAGPLAALVLLLAAAALISLWLSLRVVIASLQNLSGEAARIAQGQLDHPLPAAGVDEVGQLGQAFEQMRLGLRARLEELNQLLQVSQGVASTLEMGGAVRPVLEAILSTGASSARMVLLPPVKGQEDAPRHFSLGPAGERYAGLDDGILALVDQQGRLALGNLSRARLPELPEDQLRPAALAAVVLLHENRTYGVLWAAYDQPRSFSEENLRFLSTLAGQAALAAFNARLFRTAEVGRQRLAAILASTPDPVLVTDQESRLILANPAAKRALGAKAGAEGQPTEQIIGQKELRDLLRELVEGKKSTEVTLPDGKVYYATASLVLADERPVGRVCVMRDVTHFKELDALKSDFVASVSHDLRSPLTLMHGYATMLGMVGKLNEQQDGYVSKIIVGVESMARLVNNLLDLGRIEAGMGLEVEPVIIRELLKGVADGLRPLAEQKKIRLDLKIAPEVPETLEGDRALLQQAISNLVENAIKYTPEKGQVNLRARFQPGCIQFEVQDNGIGISPADQLRLFEKFFRGSQREARAVRGSGLGLSIVRSVAEQHGGKVWVESQLGQGSTFYLLIPLVQAEAARKKTGKGR